MCSHRQGTRSREPPPAQVLAPPMAQAECLEILHPPLVDWLDDDLAKEWARGGIGTWVTDIPHVATRQGWLYRAAVLDLFSRKVVGWHVIGASPSVSRR